MRAVFLYYLMDRQFEGKTISGLQPGQARGPRALWPQVHIAAIKPHASRSDV